MKNVYNQKGQEYLTALGRLVRKRQRRNADGILGILDSITLKEGKHLGMRVAEHVGMGDESALYTFEGDRAPAHDGPLQCYFMDNEKALFHDLTATPTAMGAWQLYLLFLAPAVLPTFWHGGYISRTYFFDMDDGDGASANVVTPLMIAASKIPDPTVSVENGKYVVRCPYWTEWGGLILETFKCTIKDDGTVRIYKPTGKTLKRYDCGILF